MIITRQSRPAPVSGATEPVDGKRGLSAASQYIALRSRLAPVSGHPRLKPASRTLLQ